MKEYSKIFSYFIFSAIFILLFGFIVQQKVEAAAGDFMQQRCWVKDNCTNARGAWEKDESILPGGCAANPTNWSCQNCDDMGGLATARCFAPSPSVPLQVGIPGVTEKYCSDYELGKEPTTCSTDKDCQQKGLGFCRPGIKGGFPGYLAAFYKFFIGFLAVAAVVMIMWGGFKRIAAAGSAESIKNANSTIISAVVGLIIALISYSLLQLVNPALVKNTMPGVEMVKPEIFGFCPSYQEAKTLYDAGYTYYECVGGSFNKLPCFKDEDCKPGAGETKNGTCVQRKDSGNPNSSCGKKLILPTGECTGMECDTAGKGCFKNSSREGFPYACSNYMMQGKLSGIEVNYLDAVLVCNNSTNGQPCGMMEVNGSRSGSLDVEKKATYVITNCWIGNSPINPIGTCQNSGGVKGIALMLERESGSGWGIIGGGADDWYAVDATTCGNRAKRIIDGDGDDDPNADVADKIDWTSVPREKLFQPYDSNGKLQPIECDLNITDAEFPDR